MTRRGGRQGGRLVAVALSALALLLALSGPAAAHTEVTRSDPPPGGTVPVGRSTITLWFEERVNVAASSFTLRTPDGLEVPATVDSVEGEQVVELRTEPLAEGTYVLDWHALSLEDGHSSSGTVVFGAGVRPAALASGGTRLPVELTLLRWLDLSALLLALGCLTVGGRVLGSAGGSRGPRLQARVRRLARYAALAVVYGGVVTPFLRTRQSGTPLGTWTDQTWVTLSATQWGRLWLLRELALLVATVAVFRWGGRGPERPRARALALAALTVAVALESLGGHASTVPGLTAPAAAMATAHVLAAGVWVGGLALLGLTLLRRRHDGDRSRPDQPDGVTMRPVWRAYSPRAAVASVVLLATGLYQAGRHVPGFGALVDTVYGLAVTAKVVLVVAALLLAGVNTLAVNPDVAARVAARVAPVVGRWSRGPGPARRFATTVAVEIAVLVVAVGAAALLSSTPTAREQASATTPSTPHAANVDGLFVTSEAVPSGGQRTRLIVRIRPTTLPEPAPVTGVDVEITGPRGSETVPLEEVEPGRYEGDSGGLTPGGWSSEVRVHRAGLLDATTSTSWRVEAPTVGETGPLRILTTGLAVLLLGGLAVVIRPVATRSLLARRSRGGREPEPAAEPRPLEESRR